MALQSPSIKLAQASDAEYRAWGLAISTALAALGLTKRAETGTVGWTTAAKPTAQAAPDNWEIWEFSDSLQATKPVLIKIEYTCQSGFPLQPNLIVSVGTGSNGTGTLTGNVGSRMGRGLATASTATTTCYLAGGAGYLSVTLFGATATAGHSITFAVERTTDNNGAHTGDGVFYWIAGSASGSTVTSGASQYVSFDTVTIPAATTSLPAILPTTTTFQLLNNVGVSPIFPLGDGVLNPTSCAFCYLNGDIVAGNQVAIDIYGTSHNYYAVGARVNTVTPNAASTLLMRID